MILDRKRFPPDHSRASSTVFTGPIYDSSGKLRAKAGQKLSQSFLLKGWTWLVKEVVSS